MRQVVVLTDSDHAGCPKNTVLHWHYARSHHPELWRVSVLRCGEGDVSRTWSSLDAQRNRS